MFGSSSQGFTIQKKRKFLIHFNLNRCFITFVCTFPWYGSKLAGLFLRIKNSFYSLAGRLLKMYMEASLFLSLPLKLTGKGGNDDDKDDNGQLKKSRDANWSDKEVRTTTMGNKKAVWERERCFVGHQVQWTWLQMVKNADWKVNEKKEKKRLSDLSLFFKIKLKEDEKKIISYHTNNLILINVKILSISSHCIIYLSLHIIHIYPLNHPFVELI